MKSVSKAMNFERTAFRKSVSKDFVRESERKTLDKIGLGRIVSYLAVRFYRQFDTEIWLFAFFGSWALYFWIKLGS